MAGVSRRAAAQGALALGALGVVFGDIGTSPLYTLQTLFDPSDPHPVKVTQESVFGVISLIFWSVTIIVTVTYVVLIMRADNDGEGGIMALIALIRRRAVPGGRRAKAILAALGIFGASLFLGDSMITPAISVLSAVEGVEVAAPSVSNIVIPITVAIIVILFMAQRLGTGAVGRAFGPIMAVWFTIIAVIGIKGIVSHPVILKALSPTYAVSFLFGHFGTAFFSLTAVVLAVTGAEALYADMGHFGRRPVRQAWILVVFPACVLNYFGQGALILGHPSSVSNPFFLAAPGWARLPMVILATLATVIASQAVISGAFSVAHQAGQLGYLPRLRIQYTSEEVMGQIYVPWINWLLLAGVLTLVLAFRTSAHLAYAYGTAVTGTITITTLLFFYYARHQWRWPLWIVLSGSGILLAIDLLFFAANLTKLTHGAWLPLLIGISAFTVFTTWQRGRELVTEKRDHEEGDLHHFVVQLHAMKPPLPRVPGTAIFLNRGKATTPLALRANVKHNEILHQQVIILALETVPAPHVPVAERLKTDDLGYKDDGIIHVAARFGYMDKAHVPSLVPLMHDIGVEGCAPDGRLSYFVSRIELVPGHTPGMSHWRKRLFIATSRITADAAESFGLPRERTVIMGSRLEL
ncbi:MAG TPA: KUP/HAK/KT family potassium transporter [Streptosporangiaceae bacterium]